MRTETIQPHLYAAHNACPKCAAAPLAPCITVRGTEAFGNHLARINARDVLAAQLQSA